MKNEIIFDNEFKVNKCHFCDKIGNFDFALCDDCLELGRKKMLILKNGEWQFNKDRVINKLLKNNYFDPNKKYTLKESFCGKYEKILYEVLLNKLDDKYIAFPQINLQTIIETDSKYRNDELYRNLDFCIFEKKSLKPVLAIELNDILHTTKESTKKRDESVKQILSKAGLPLLTIKNDDLYKLTTIQIYDIVKAALPK